MTKQQDVICEVCGTEFEQSLGRGRPAKRCPDCRTPKGKGKSLHHPEPYAPRSLADHPALLARQAKHGAGRAAAHRPLGIRTVTTTGKVPRRRGNL